MAKLLSLQRAAFPSIFVTGPPGVGKSHLAAAIVFEFLMRFPGEAVFWTRTTRLLMELRDSMRDGGQRSTTIAEAHSGVPLLVLHDLGAENQTEFAMSAIYDILDERIESNRPTIVTSNLDLDTVAQREPRLASRLGGFQIAKLAGRDRRRRS